MAERLSTRWEISCFASGGLDVTPKKWGALFDSNALQKLIRHPQVKHLVHVGLDARVSYLEVRAEGSTEVGHFVLVSAGIGASIGVPQLVTVSNPSWEPFRTEDAIALDDFEGYSRLYSVGVGPASYSGIALSVGIDHGSLLHDLANGDSVSCGWSLGAPFLAVSLAEHPVGWLFRVDPDPPDDVAEQAAADPRTAEVTDGEHDQFTPDPGYSDPDDVMAPDGDDQSDPDDVLAQEDDGAQSSPEQLWSDPDDVLRDEAPESPTELYSDPDDLSAQEIEELRSVSTNYPDPGDTSPAEIAPPPDGP